MTIRDSGFGKWDIEGNFKIVINYFSKMIDIFISINIQIEDIGNSMHDLNINVIILSYFVLYFFHYKAFSNQDSLILINKKACLKLQYFNAKKIYWHQANDFDMSHTLIMNTLTPTKMLFLFISKYNHVIHYIQKLILDIEKFGILYWHFKWDIGEN